MYPQMALTDTAVRNAKPKEKPYKLGDSGGLYVIVRPNGSKLWRYKYRLGGKANSRGLGKYPDVSLKEARRRRDECRQDVANGVNPRGRWKVEHAASMDDTTETFESVARAWYDSKLPNWEPGTSSMVLMRLERYVFPKLGARLIADVGAQDIHAMLKPIQDQEKYETASRVLTVCHQVCDYAMFSERITRNPAAPVKHLLTKPKPTHFAAVTDPKDIGKLLRMLAAYEGSPAVMAALNLAPLWFVRPGELRHAKWAAIDLDAAEWRFRVSKTKTDLIVSLSEQAVAILRDLHPHTGHQSWVFPGARNNGRPMSENTLAVAMRTIGIPKDTMSVHGFRAMARTCLDEQLGVAPHLIEHQLAHTVRDPLGRAYNRTTHLPERRDMMQRWADYLDELRSETTS
jgi:integrase